MEKIVLSRHTDPRGSLIPIQFDAYFPVKRTYFIYPNLGHSRGGHRHKECRQIIYCCTGQATIYLHTAEYEKEVILTNNFALLVEPHEWHQLKDFSEKCVIVVFCSHLYDSHDYILEKESPTPSKSP